MTFFVMYLGFHFLVLLLNKWDIYTKLDRVFMGANLVLFQKAVACEFCRNFWLSALVFGILSAMAGRNEVLVMVFCCPALYDILKRLGYE